MTTSQRHIHVQCHITILHNVPYLILVVDAVATLDDVLLDVPEVDGGRQLPPLPAVLSRAPHPDRKVLVDEKRLGTGGDPITRLSLPDLRPLQEHIIARLIAKSVQEYTHIPLTICICMLVLLA